MKKLFTIALLIFCVTVVYAQTSTTTHIVQRGETITSVAQKYGVSVQEIEKANPSANGYFYTGMKLTIPVPAGNSSISNSKEQIVSVQESKEAVAAESADYTVNAQYEAKPENSINERFFFLGYLDGSYHNMIMTTKVDGKSESSNVNGFALGFRFMPTLTQDNILATYFGLDYECCFDSESKSSGATVSYVSKSRYSDFKIPLGLQLNLILAPECCISPYAGLNCIIGVTSKTEMTTTTTTTTDYGKYSFVSGITKTQTNKETIDNYDRDKMGSYAWQRANIGWDVGVKIALGSIVLNVSYESNFTNTIAISDIKYYMKRSGFTAGLGIIF